MALQSVPWAIGNGAHNQVEGARLSLYASTGGRGGVMSPTDMQVSALPVPGGAVRVHTGGVVIISGYPGASSQAYAARETSSTDVEITATGSSGGRTSYLVARVHDHQYSGEPTPASIENGPYNEYEWISQDPRTTSLPYPVEGLAKVTQPANTQTITQDMIEDIRQLAQPKRDQIVFGRPRIVQDDPDDNPRKVTELTVRNTTGGEYFPGGNGVSNRVDLFIPDYATRMHIEASWMGVAYEGAMNSFGTFWMEFGDEYRDRTWPGNQQWEFSTQRFAFNGTRQGAGDTARDQWKLMDAVYVPPKLRGKTVAFVWKAGLATNSDQGVSMDSLGGLGLRLDFAQTPIDIHTV